ncbi:hypothetical protein F5I97DRAFT_1306508 [Phlebopus sp. FC_14]|nr:hypothetical protein F5I97DRAFT_1306508 [Phlebopus sp. FC_14]
MIPSTNPRTISPTHGERLVSPPRTPPTNAVDASKNTRQPSTSPSDDSSLIELSFDYELNSAGNYVRVSKGSARSNGSSPPTPHEILFDGPLAPKPSSPPLSSAQAVSYAYTKPPSPTLLNSPAPARRNSLSRSESAYSAHHSVPPDHRAQTLLTGTSARSFQRVASGPAAITPWAQPSLRAPASNGPRGTGRKLGRPQRVPLDDYRQQQAEERGEWGPHIQEEKENILAVSSDAEGMSSDSAPRRVSPRLASRSASLSQVDGRAISGLPTRAYGSSVSVSGTNPVARPPLQPGRQIMPGPNRAVRVLMGAKYGVGSGGFEKINEHEGSESEAGVDYAGEETDTGGDEPQPLNGLLRQRSYVPPVSQSNGNRPRRSASLSDASGSTFPFSTA